MFEYLSLLLKLIGNSLILNERAWEIVANNRQSTSLVIGLVFLAGVSTLVGQSVILFINRIRRGRLLFGLAFNGLLLIISYLVWGLIIYLVGGILFPISPSVGSVLRLVGLSAAPLVFGFFVLIPYAGTAIGKLLHVWSLMILISVVSFSYQADFILSAATVGLGWLVMLMISRTVGKPVVKLRNRLWEKATGTSSHKTAQDILLDYSSVDSIDEMRREP